MIVREIVEHPELIEDFDWFNDYQDTRMFLIKTDNFELLHKFNEAYAKWTMKFGNEPFT